MKRSQLVDKFITDGLRAEVCSGHIRTETAFIFGCAQESIILKQECSWNHRPSPNHGTQTVCNIIYNGSVLSPGRTTLHNIYLLTLVRSRSLRPTGSWLRRLRSSRNWPPSRSPSGSCSLMCVCWPELSPWGLWASITSRCKYSCCLFGDNRLTAN